MAEWMEQFERTKRSLKKIENQDRNSIDYNDDLWHFFQDCHHLKDWIKNDTNTSVPKSIKGKVEKYITKNLELKICADLANRSKHLKLDRNIRVDAKVTSQNATINPPTARMIASANGKSESAVDSNSLGTSTCEHIITTLSDGKTYIALDVARKAVELWSTFLRDNKLI